MICQRLSWQTVIIIFNYQLSIIKGNHNFQFSTFNFQFGEKWKRKLSI